MVGIGGLFGVAEAYRTTYGTFVYWLGRRALNPQKAGSEPPSVTIGKNMAFSFACRSPINRPLKRAAATT